MSWRKSLQRWIKSLPLPGRQMLYLSRSLSDERDYSRIVGDGTNNSIVAACIQFVVRTFPEAPPMMWQEDDLGVRQRVVRHPMVQLIRRPNPFYSGNKLWAGTLWSWFGDGNAYWLKVRGRYGNVVQLWYVPHWFMEPKWPQDGSVFIDHYDYQVNGRTISIPPSEVVHFRYGLDPENTRKGRSPLYAILREVFTDEEAARFSASILKNLGVPGVMLSPAQTSTGVGWRAGTVDTEAIKTAYMEKFNGDHRGEPLITSSPMNLVPFGFSPQQMDLSALRDVAEERVTAAIGLPAAVVGFGTGLQQTKVGATMAEMRSQAWEGCIIPAQGDMSEEAATQLLPDFEAHPENFEFGFDLSRVRVLQEDVGKIAQRWAILFLSGLAKRKEARSAFDLISDDKVDDFYAMDLGIPLSPRGIPTPPKIGSGSAPAADGGGNAQSSDLQGQLDDLTAQVQQLLGQRGE